MQNPYIRKMYKAMIFDDEASASAVLKLMINRYIPRINEIRIANNFDAAMQMLEDFKPDLLFLDIMMPGKTGFEFLSSLQAIDFDIIFTTASDEFAIRAIRFSALDYLLKPINAEELKQAFARFLEKREKSQTSTALLSNLLENIDEQKEGNFKLAIPTTTGAVFVKISEIVRLEGDSNYTHFYFSNGKKHLSAKTIKEYEEILIHHDFIRLHKSHLVNVTFIKNIANEGKVTLEDGAVIPVSRQRKKEVFEKLKFSGGGK